jgi:hypothetical protein
LGSVHHLFRSHDRKPPFVSTPVLFSHFIQIHSHRTLVPTRYQSSRIRPCIESQCDLTWQLKPSSPPLRRTTPWLKP